MVKKKITRGELIELSFKILLTVLFLIEEAWRNYSSFLIGEGHRKSTGD
jgi:hypothetical protein